MSKKFLSGIEVTGLAEFNSGIKATGLADAVGDIVVKLADDTFASRPRTSLLGDITTGTSSQYIRGNGTYATFPTLISASELSTGTATTGRLISAERLNTWVNTLGFLTSYTETDPTVPSHVKAISTGDISSWNTAFGWGDHAGKYVVNGPSSDYTGILGSGSLNDQRTGITWVNTGVANRPFDQNSTVLSAVALIGGNDYGFQISGRNTNLGVRTVEAGTWGAWERLATQEWATSTFQPAGNYQAAGRYFGIGLDQGESFNSVEPAMDLDTIATNTVIRHNSGNTNAPISQVGMTQTLSSGSGASAIGWQHFYGHSLADSFYYRGKAGGSYNSWLQVASREWVTAQNYQPAGDYVTRTTDQTITGVKTFSNSIQIAAYPSVDGTQGSSNALPQGLAYKTISNDANYPYDGAALLWNTNGTNNRLFEILGSTINSRMWVRSLHNGFAHTWAEVWTDKNFTPGNYALASHTHPASEITPGTFQTGTYVLDSSSILRLKRLELGNTAMFHSGDSNYIHFTAPSGVIPATTTTASNTNLGTTSYRWKGVYAGVGNFEGSVTAASFIKSGGTASQFLKADGSVDTNTYALNSALGDYVQKSGDTMTGNLSFSSGSGKGIRFWSTSDGYSIWMSASSDATYGGAVQGAPAGDYNMYFRMTDNASNVNRGFVFGSARNDQFFSIAPLGVRSLVPISVDSDVTLVELNLANGNGGPSKTLSTYSSSRTDITSLVGGSGFGTYLKSDNNGHLVVGIDGNDSNDSFSVLASNVTSTTADKAMNIAVLRAMNDGRVLMPSLGTSASGGNFVVDLGGTNGFKLRTPSEVLSSIGAQAAGNFVTLDANDPQTVLSTKSFDVIQKFKDYTGAWIEVGKDQYGTDEGFFIQPSVNGTTGGIIFGVRSGGGSPRFVVEHSGNITSSNSDMYLGTATDRTGGDRVFHDGYHPNADKWTNARTLTIGNTGKPVDGSGNQSWSLSEIGAADASHTHSDLTAGTGLTGSTYNGGTARTWSFDTTWGDARYQAKGNYVNGLSKSWSSVDTDPGVDAWYTIITGLNENNNAPIYVNMRAYAHTTLSFVVVDGYTSSGNITVLGYTQSINNGYKYVKGVRLTSTGQVQVLLNGGSSVSVEIQVHGTSNTGLSLPSTLALETGSPTISHEITSLLTKGIETRNARFEDIWLTNITGKNGDFVTIDSNGQLFKRSAANTLTDIGAQPAGNYAIKGSTSANGSDYLYLMRTGGGAVFYVNQRGSTEDIARFFAGTSDVESNPTGTTKRFIIERSGGTFSTGNQEALSFTKTGGVATEFLKADGSVDTRDFLPFGINNGSIPQGIGINFNSLPNSMFMESVNTGGTTNAPSGYNGGTLLSGITLTGGAAYGGRLIMGRTTDSWFIQGANNNVFSSWARIATQEWVTSQNYQPAGDYVLRTGDTMTGTLNAPTFNATSTTNGGFQGIDADSATTPSFTWSSDQNTGMWRAGTDSIGWTTAGTNRLTLSTSTLTSTLPMQLPNGTVSAPALRFSSDTNTGVYRIDANNLGFSQNGVLRFTVGTSGIVVNGKTVVNDMIVSSSGRENQFSDSSNGLFTFENMAYAINNTSSATGNIKISLPDSGASSPNQMTWMKVMIYTYGTGDPVEVSVSFYQNASHAYSSANIISGNGSFITQVRTGTEGTRRVVWIDTSGTLSYPKVVLREVMYSHSSANASYLKETANYAIAFTADETGYTNVTTITRANFKQSSNSLDSDITGVSLSTSTLTLTRAIGNLTTSVPTWNQNTTGSAATLTTARTLTIGSTGKTFNGSANVSWSLAEIGAASASHTHVKADITDLEPIVEASTVSTIVKRNGSGDINVRLVRSEYANQSTISGALAFRVNNSNDNYIRFCSDTSAIKTWLGAANASHTHPWTDITGKPTTVSGYGILDAVEYHGSTNIDHNNLSGGFWRNTGNINGPSGFSHTTVLHGGSSQSANQYAWQLAIHTQPTANNAATQKLAFRGWATDITTSPWVEVWHTGNFTPGDYAVSSHTHQNLTAGTGITGSTYNGGTARTWSFDTTWGDARYSLAPEGVYYVEGNTSGTSGDWTGTHPRITSLYDGLMITYKIGVAGANPTDLNINGLGNIRVRRATSNMTTHLPVGTVVLLTYTTISGTGYWVWADWSTSYSTMSLAEMEAGTATAGRIIRSDYLNQWGDGKYAPISHTHDIAEVTGLQAELDDKAPLTHTHSWAQIVDKPTFDNKTQRLQIDSSLLSGTGSLEQQVADYINSNVPILRTLEHNTLFVELTDYDPGTGGGGGSTGVTTVTSGLKLFYDFGASNWQGSSAGYIRDFSPTPTEGYMYGGVTHNTDFGGYMAINASSQQFITSQRVYSELGLDSGGYSLVFLVRFPDVSGWTRVVSASGYNGVGSSLQAGTASGNLQLDYYGGATGTSANTISSNTWYHIVMTRDGSNNVVMYLNGVNIFTGTLGALNQNYIVYFGRWVNSYATYDLGVAMIYDRAITGTEAGTLYNEQRTRFSI